MRNDDGAHPLGRPLVVLENSLVALISALMLSNSCYGRPRGPLWLPAGDDPTSMQGVRRKDDAVTAQAQTDRAAILHELAATVIGHSPTVVSLPGFSAVA
jgi:hypothetical protein